MKRLLVVLFAVGMSQGANWDNAVWHTIHTVSSISIENLTGLTCRGDTTYLMPFGANNQAELIRWSPDDETQTLELPFQLIAVYGFNHADSLKRFPGVLQGPTLWRLAENGWDSTRVGTANRWPSCFAVGPNGALHYLLHDSLTAGVIYRRSGGAQPEIDTVITPCIQLPFVGHWVGVDHLNTSTCVIEENYPSGEDHWIPCIKVVRFSDESVESAVHGWHSLNRRYLQGGDGRWLVVRDFDTGGLLADIFSGVSVESSSRILDVNHTFRLAQNPLDSLFEAAGMPRNGSFGCEVYGENPEFGQWEFTHFFDSPASVRALHVMIDQYGDGHVFVADSNTIYRYGPPPRIMNSTPRVTLPNELALSVYPNPGNAEFRLSYSLTRSSDVALSLFDVTGRKVATLVDDARGAGEHVVNWNASSQASGVYFAVLNAGSERVVTKLVLMK